MAPRSTVSTAVVAVAVIFVVSMAINWVHTSAEVSSAFRVGTRASNMPCMRASAPQMYRRGKSFRVRSSVEDQGVVIKKSNTDLLNDIAEGQTLDEEAYTPSSWAEYEAFVAETGGPEPMVEGGNDVAMGTAPISTSYGLNVIWLEKNIALAIDEEYPGGKRIPLTNFHLWPQTDAWEELKAILDEREWIGETQTINVLNQATEIINYWQESHSTAEAREKFPDVLIRGTEQVEGSSMDGGAVEAAMVEEGPKVVDTSAIPRVSIKEAPGFEALMPGLAWYRDPTEEGPWDSDSGVWKDVSIRTIEELQRSVPQRNMPGQR